MNFSDIKPSILTLPFEDAMRLVIQIRQERRIPKKDPEKKKPKQVVHKKTSISQKDLLAALRDIKEIHGIDLVGDILTTHRELKKECTQ